MGAVLLVALLLVTASASWARPDPTIGINVLLNTPITKAMLKDLGVFGKANTLDAINVTDFWFGNRTVDSGGEGVYVAVLDTGLVRNWRAYFPEERIATKCAVSFGVGPTEHASTPEQPSKWERDTNSHGTHVASTILGYWILIGGGWVPVNGVVPKAGVIPVTALNQNGGGWSGAIAQGIIYVADLKAGPMPDHPVVINMRIGGPELDAVEGAAIKYAIGQGVIIVGSAWSNAEGGMGYRVRTRL